MSLYIFIGFCGHISVLFFILYECFFVHKLGSYIHVFFENIYYFVFNVLVLLFGDYITVPFLGKIQLKKEHVVVSYVQITNTQNINSGNSEQMNKKGVDNLGTL